MADEAPNLALLIDGENANPNCISDILVDASRIGHPTIRRVYGNCRGKKWSQLIDRYAIQPVQQLADASQKNATDITMIIDAIDILHERRIDGFCLATSDADFVGLALRLRNAGKRVFVYGDDRAPDSLRKSCERFVLIQRVAASGPAPAPNVAPAAKQGDPAPAKKSTMPAAPAPKKQTIDDDTVRRMIAAIKQSAEPDGWSRLEKFATGMAKAQPNFSAKRYGFGKLSSLIRAMPDTFVLKKIGTPAIPHVKTRDP